MENQSSVFDAPTSANVTVMSKKRPREYLTDAEIERLMAAARDNRHGHRDATAILVAYRHALRSSELVTLRWDDVDFTTSRLHVRRAKGGETAVHPISGKELSAPPLTAGERAQHLHLCVGTSGAVERRRLSADGCPSRRRGRVSFPRP